MSKERELLIGAVEWMQELKYVYADARDSGDRVLLELIADINKIENLLAQPEQEPVAWMWDEMFCEDWTTVSSVIKPSKSKYVDNVRPLYLAPPKREPLSDEEVRAKYRDIALDNPLYVPSYYAGFRDAERAHGIGGGNE